MKTILRFDILVLLAFCSMIFVHSARKSKLDSKIDALDRLFRSELYLVNEKIEIGRYEREMLMEMCNKTLRYPETDNKGRESDLKISDQIEQNVNITRESDVKILSDKVEQNDNRIEKLSQSVIHIRRGILSEKKARTRDTDNLIEQLVEIKQDQAKLLRQQNDEPQSLAEMEQNQQKVLSEQNKTDKLIEQVAELKQNQDKLLNKQNETDKFIGQMAEMEITQETLLNKQNDTDYLIEQMKLTQEKLLSDYRKLLTTHLLQARVLAEIVELLFG